MPVSMKGRTYYRTAEVCKIVGISKNTLFRWLKEDIVKEPQHRDRRGWRLFTKSEIANLKGEVNHISRINRDSS